MSTRRAARPRGDAQRTFSWADPAATAAAGAAELSGLEYISAIVDGALPPPPIAELLGFEVVEVEHGPGGVRDRAGRVDVQPDRLGARRHRRDAARLVHGLRGAHDARRRRRLHDDRPAGPLHPRDGRRDRARARRGPRRARRPAHGDGRGAAVRRGRRDADRARRAPAARSSAERSRGRGALSSASSPRRRRGRPARPCSGPAARSRRWGRA